MKSDSEKKSAAAARVFKISGEKLAALRKKKYLTQSDVAGALEIETRNVARIEQSDAAGMYWRRVPRLAALMKVEPEELIRLIGAEDAPTGRLAEKTYSLAADAQAVEDFKKMAPRYGLDEAGLVAKVFELGLQAWRAADYRIENKALAGKGSVIMRKSGKGTDPRRPRRPREGPAPDAPQ